MFHLLILLLVPAAFTQKCTFDNLSTYSPIILNRNLTLPSIIEYERNEDFYIICPKHTSSSFIAQNGDWVTCAGGTSIFIIRTLDAVDFFELNCIPNSNTVVEKLDEKCENHGTIIEIGPEIQGNFSSEITVCFNEEKMVPFYTRYEIKPILEIVKPLKENVTYEDYICGEVRPCMFTDLSHMYSINLDYLYHDQALILENLNVEVPNHKLVKFPLSQDLFAHELPQKIQSYPSWQEIQTVPFWNNTCLISSWVYNYVYYHSPAYNFKYTGTLEVATLPNANNDPVELYLNTTTNQIPVPKWIWMVDQQNQALRFMYNTFTSCDSSGFSDLLVQEASEFCKTPTVDSYLVTCFYVDVTHPGLMEFIDTQFCQNGDCE